MRELPKPAMRILRIAFLARAAWYRIRYPRLVVGAETMLIGRLQIRGRTRVILKDQVRVRRTVRITGGGTVVVGPRTLLNGCWIVATENVTIGGDCLISDCGITDSDFHNLPPALRHAQPTDRTRSPVTISDNVWVGLSALVLKGSTVGKDSVVGAGSVVRGQVPPGVVVAGDPPQILKRFKADT
jgi:acetyltransferase-like isoleucine patch superfamily enzyme